MQGNATPRNRDCTVRITREQRNPYTTTTQQRDLTGKKKSRNETANTTRNQILPWPKTQSQRTQVQSRRGGSPETWTETQRRHPIRTVHLHCHKGNWLHNPRLESQWWEKSMPRCIQIQAAQNNLHPSKKQTKANTYCKTSSTTNS